MLYFRTETGIDPGQDMDERCILLHPVSPVPKHLIDVCIRFCFLSTTSSTFVARDVSLGTKSVSCLHFFCSNRARNRNQDPESRKPRSVDNFAKPTLAWSTIGRPWTGWLHWGMDNDGGYMSPPGGQEWDPSVVNPAEGGGYGPTTKEYIKEHPPHTSLVKGGAYEGRAGTPLFGMADVKGGEQLAMQGVNAGAGGGEFGSMQTMLGGTMQPVVPSNGV